MTRVVLTAAQLAAATAPDALYHHEASHEYAQKLADLDLFFFTER